MTTKVIGDNTGNDYSGTANLEINSFLATSNLSGNAGMENDNEGSAFPVHCLLSFSGLSNITGPVTVSSVSLDLYLSQENPALWDTTLTIYRLLQNWVEAQATWNIYSTGNNWSTAGGNDTTDRSSTVSASIAGFAPANVGHYQISTAQMATDVQNWINGVNSNYGWILVVSDGTAAQDFKKYATRQGTNGQRPALTVTYGAPQTYYPFTNIQQLGPILAQ